MREYKFRVWDKFKKEMIYDGIEYQLRVLEYPILEKESTIIGFEDNPEYFDIMEFATICDKNGKDIYESDILKFRYWSTYEQRSFPEYVDFRETDMKEAHGIVYWNDSELSWYVKPISATVYNGSERLVPLEDMPLVYTGITMESIREWVGEDDINKYIGCVSIEIIGNKHSNSELLHSL